MTPRRRLLAGSVGPERVPLQPDPDDADWFLPQHVHEPQLERERIAGQIAFGADLVVAPTWLTHRRALLPIGETRRAASWTEAAVRVAREGVELGLERREERLESVPDDDPGHGRPTPLIAASLPSLGEEPEASTGRLAGREAATERDYRDQAGHLADALPDLILVEGQWHEAEARVAIAEAVQTGLPVWAALTPGAAAAFPAEDWLDWSRPLGVGCLLLPSLEDAVAGDRGDRSWGGLVDDADQVTAWLEAGADVVASLDGAGAVVLGQLRAAIDGYEQADLAAVLAGQRRWNDAVERAATMTPGGAAVWLGARAAIPLPGGFDWLVTPADEAPQLPAGRYRLAIAAERISDPGRLLEHGGVLVTAVDGRPATNLRLLSLDDGDPPMAIFRRED